VGQALRAGRRAGPLALLWLQFYARQTMLVLMRGLEDAFAYFGGVPGAALRPIEGGDRR